MSNIGEKIKSRIKGKRPILGGAVSRVRPNITTKELNESGGKSGKNVKFQEESKVRIKEPLNKEIPREFEEYIGTKDIESSYVYSLDDVELIGKYAIPITKDGQYIIDEFVRESTLRELLGKTSDKFLFTKVLGPKIRPRVKNIRKKVGIGRKNKERSVINLVPRHFGGKNHSRHGNYGHWVAEDLPRLKGFETYKDKVETEAKILIMRDPPSWMTETLRLLGYCSADWYEWDRESETVSNLIVPDLYHFHSRNTDLNPNGRRWVSKKIKKNVNMVGTEELPKRIFPSRQGSDFRKIANFKEVKGVLDEFGVIPIRNEDMSVGEQVRLYSQAELIVGPFGANLTNILFASDATVIEIFNHGDIRPVYFVTASEQNLRYGYIVGENSTSEYGAKESDIYLDPNKLSRVLDNVLG